MGPFTTYKEQVQGHWEMNSYALLVLKGSQHVTHCQQEVAASLHTLLSTHEHYLQQPNRHHDESGFRQLFCIPLLCHLKV
jgi:hypothetical protein